MAGNPDRGAAAAERRHMRNQRRNHVRTGGRTNSPMGDAAVGNVTGIAPGHVAGVRKVLREHGYAVSASGKLTARLLSAWKHYRSAIHSAPAGHRSRAAQAWNRRNPLDTSAASTQAYADRMAGANKRAGTKTKAKGHAKAVGGGAGGGGAGGGGAGGGGGSDLGIPDMSGDMPTGGTDVNALVPRDMADTLAGLQYDPQIHDLMTQLAEGQRTAAQSQSDIGNWYGAVDKSQETARQRDAATGHAVADDQQGAIQSIVQSLGGSRGAGVVGAAGVNDLAALRGGAQAQDQYNNDLQPLLHQEEAGAHSRQAALASQAAAALQSQLTGARGARGQAQAQALMQIIQANNQSRQSNFGNKLALQNAALAAQSMGLDVAKLGLATRQTDAQIAASQAAARQRGQAQHLQTHPNWAALNDTDRQTLISRALQTGIAAIPKGAPYDPGHVLNVALGYLRQAGYGSARKNSYVRRGGHVASRANQQAILGRLSQAIAQARNTYGQQQ